MVQNETIREGDVLTCRAVWDNGVLEKKWNATLFEESNADFLKQPFKATILDPFESFIKNTMKFLDNALATCRVVIDNHEDGTITHDVQSPNYSFGMNDQQHAMWSLDEYGNRIFVDPMFVKPNADVYIECEAAKNGVDFLFFKGDVPLNKTNFYESIDFLFLL